MDDKKQKEQKIMQRSHRLSLVGIALFILVAFLLTKNIPSPYEQNVEAVQRDIDAHIALELLLQNQEGELVELDHTPLAGERVAFKVSASQPVHAALLASVNQQRPAVLLTEERIPPGQSRQLKHGNSFYSYEVKQGEEHITFCLLSAKESGQLRQSLHRPIHSIKDLPSDWCAGW